MALILVMTVNNSLHAVKESCMQIAKAYKVYNVYCYIRSLLLLNNYTLRKTIAILRHAHRKTVISIGCTKWACFIAYLPFSLISVGNNSIDFGTLTSCANSVITP
jgi:hypothetical protein